MSFHRALPFILTALGGVAIGWVIKPTPTHADTAKPTNEPVLKRETRRAGNEDSRIAARWIDKMGTGDLEKIRREVPTGEMKAVMDGLLEGMWGSLSQGDLIRMQTLIGEWAERDPEGALAWARGLRHPQQREVGLVYIAAAIGQKDPEAGFAIYSEVEKLTMSELSSAMYGVMFQLCKNAVQQGPDALLDIINRTPKSDRFSMGLQTTYPEGFDFPSLLQGMADAGHFKREGSNMSVFTVESPLSAWAAIDREAAFAFLAEHSPAGTRHNFYEFTQKVAASSSQAEMKEWIGGKLAAMDPSQRRELVQGSMIGYPVDYVNRFIEMMPTQESATELRYEILQSYNDAGWSVDYGILNEVPEVEDRVATVERLRGLKDYHAEELASQLRKWNVPQERIDGIVEKAKRKE